MTGSHRLAERGVGPWDEFQYELTRSLTVQLDFLAKKARLEQDAGSSSRKNLDDMAHYVTAVRPSDHQALLAEAAGQLVAVQRSAGAELLPGEPPGALPESNVRWWWYSARNFTRGNCGR